MPSHHRPHHRKRKKVITDQLKYRRHQLKKMYRMLAKFSVYGSIILVFALLLWLILHLLGKLPFFE